MRYREDAMTTADRLKHAAAIMLIGDGVAGALHPTHASQFWKKGPAGWRRGMRWCQMHPEKTRLLAIAEAAIGVMWILHAERGAKKLFG
jgi:hypothetical protein